MTEYDHLFWSPYRYEAGLAAPSFAAMQGWDVLCRHAHGPIILAYGEDFPHKKQMLPYAIALDPQRAQARRSPHSCFGVGM